MATSVTDRRRTTPDVHTLRSHLAVFGTLMVAATLALAAIVPYALALSGNEIPDGMYWTVLLFSVVQSLVLVAPLTALGLWLGPKVGLGAPLLYAWVEGRRDTANDRVRHLPRAAGVGAIVGAVLIGIGLAFLPWLPEELRSVPVPAWWQAMLASLSAGVSEELMLRLGLMTLLVWLGAKLTRSSPPSTTLVWAANGITALIFGLGHLPLAASLAPLTTMMVIRTLLMNGIAGLTFGWVYWRYGLVAAMVAHASTDLVLHVLSRALPVVGL